MAHIKGLCSHNNLPVFQQNSPGRDIVGLTWTHYLSLIHPQLSLMIDLTDYRVMRVVVLCDVNIVDLDSNLTVACGCKTLYLLLMMSHLPGEFLAATFGRRFLRQVSISGQLWSLTNQSRLNPWTQWAVARGLHERNSPLKIVVY